MKTRIFLFLMLGLSGWALVVSSAQNAASSCQPPYPKICMFYYNMCRNNVACHDDADYQGLKCAHPDVFKKCLKKILPKKFKNDKVCCPWMTTKIDSEMCVQYFIFCNDLSTDKEYCFKHFKSKLSDNNVHCPWMPSDE